MELFYGFLFLCQLRPSSIYIQRQLQIAVLLLSSPLNNVFFLSNPFSHFISIKNVSKLNWQI